MSDNILFYFLDQSWALKTQETVRRVETKVRECNFMIRAISQNSEIQQHTVHLYLNVYYVMPFFSFKARQTLSSGTLPLILYDQSSTWISANA